MLSGPRALASASEAADYMLHEYLVRNDKAHRTANRWHGGGAEALDLPQRVSRRRFVAVLEGHVPARATRSATAQRCTGIHKRRIEGSPDPVHVSTSYAERNNLTMRMSMRRFTRLTNAFSKKIENHAHSVALHFMHYNFCRQHKSLGGISPAMAASVTDRLWDI